MAPLSSLSVDELADGICLRAGRIAAAQADLLLWIAEFDRREGWGGVGMLSCAHWLSWRVGMSLGTARDQVRVARRLEELPELATAFGDGRVSYSKVRAITRVADPADGVDWVDLARHSSAAQLDKIVRAVHRVRANEEAEADPELAAWKVRTRVRYDDRGGFVMTISGPADQLPVVRAGLDAKKAELQREHDAAVRANAEAAAGSATDVPSTAPPSAPPPVDVPAGAPSPPGPETREAGTVTDADALLALAQDALEAERAIRPDTARRRRPQLTAQVDPLSGWARQNDGELVPPSSLRQVMKTLPGRGGVVRLRPITDADLRRHDLGRTQREANAALRELLGTLDGERCRFPGCTRHKNLHAHHVVHWSDGGPTDLANLVLVCSRHHTLVHAQGYQLVLHPDRRFDVRTADGVPLLHHPAQPWGDPAALVAGCGQLVSAETLPPDHAVGRLDLRYVVSVLMTQAA